METKYHTLQERRSIALRWWATELTPEQRVEYTSLHHGDERHPHTLTGREIEDIYQTAIS